MRNARRRQQARGGSKRHARHAAARLVGIAALTAAGAASADAFAPGIPDAVSFDFPHGALRLSVTPAGEVTLAYSALLPLPLESWSPERRAALIDELRARLRPLEASGQRAPGVAYGVVHWTMRGTSASYALYDADWARRWLALACATRSAPAEADEDAVIARACAEIARGEEGQ